MKVSEALLARKSVRAFQDKSVEQEKIHTILDMARHTPSGVNTQPWQVAVVTGNTKLKLQEKIEAQFRTGDKGGADYQYYPSKWIEPYNARRKECGLLMYSTLKIERTDRERQTDQWAANYRSFDAPVMLLFFIDAEMQTGSYMDYGMFLQSVMLTAEEEGLATCAQASIADYPEIVKAELNINSTEDEREKVLLCAMALGYENKDAVINSYRTSRAEVEEFTTYFE